MPACFTGMRRRAELKLLNGSIEPIAVTMAFVTLLGRKHLCDLRHLVSGVGRKCRRQHHTYEDAETDAAGNYDETDHAEPLSGVTGYGHSS